jgi:hypothetical protein
MNLLQFAMIIPIGISMYVGAFLSDPPKQQLGATVLGIQATVTPSPTVTSTLTPSPTSTMTPTPTSTPRPTPTPTDSPTPTPSPIPVTGQQMDTWFTDYSNHYSIDRSKLWRIAVCESNLRPSATNGIYGGLYQFSPSAWIATRGSMNMDTNPTLRFNPEEAIRTAAFKLSVSGSGAWPNCGK